MPSKTACVEEKTEDAGRPQTFVVVMAVTLIAEILLILGWILTKANHGFDLSDESFYLSWTEGPRDYPVSVTQFGFVHSLIFAVLRDDVVLFRQFNILTTYALTIVVAYQLLGERLRSLGSGVISTFAIVSAFALPSLKVMNYWLFTPSYNSLNGMAFLLVCIGIFSKADTDGKQSRAALMIGVGGCLSFLAKPTAALVLGVMVLIFVWGVRKWALKSLAVAVCTAVVILLFSMFWIGGGPISFVAELRETLAIATDPSHSFGRLIRWDSPHMNGGVRIVFIVVSMLLVAFLRFRKGSPSESVVRFFRQFFSVDFLALGAIGIASAWLEFRGVTLEFLKHSDDAEASKERFLLLSTLSLALIAGRWGEIDRPKLATAFFLFWLPYAYAFGTNINYWDKGASVAFFWVLSFGVLMTALPARRCQFFMFLMIASLLPILSVLDLETSYTQPYLQKPLNQVSLASVRVGRGDTELLVSEKTADFIRVWRRSAAEAGFRKGAPVIDLSGQGNGLIYLLGGTASL